MAQLSPFSDLQSRSDASIHETAAACHDNLSRVGLFEFFCGNPRICKSE